MIFFKCDQCGCTTTEEMQVSLKGYYPANIGGILLSETHRRFEFCCHKCFVAWAKWALAKESET